DPVPTLWLWDHCHAVCQQPGDAGETDHWGWENQASCVGPDNEFALNRPSCIDGGKPPNDNPQIRVSGECFPLCTVGAYDFEDGDEFAWDEAFGVQCVVRESNLGRRAPWCDDRQADPPYDAIPSEVNEDTQSVAVLPRPERIEVSAPSD